MSGIAWLVVLGLVALCALITAVIYPPSRRWIAALVVLAVFGSAALISLAVAGLSTMDSGGPLPLGQVLFAVVLAVMGLGLAGAIVLSGWERPGA